MRFVKHQRRRQDRLERDNAAVKQLEYLRRGGPPLASQLPYFDFDERDSLFLLDLLDDLEIP